MGCLVPSFGWILKTDKYRRRAAPPVPAAPGPDPLGTSKPKASGVGWVSGPRGVGFLLADEVWDGWIMGQCTAEFLLAEPARPGPSSVQG